MERFKTLVFCREDPQGERYLVDTIWRDGAWWLVATWHAPRRGGAQFPARIFRPAAADDLVEVRGQEYRFALETNIPKAVLDGQDDSEYETLDLPPGNTR